MKERKEERVRREEGEKGRREGRWKVEREGEKKKRRHAGTHFNGKKVLGVKMSGYNE